MPFSYMRQALAEAGFETLVDVRDHSKFGVRLGSKAWDGLFYDGLEIDPKATYQFKSWPLTVIRLALVVGSWVGLCSKALPGMIDIMSDCREGMVRGGPHGLDIFTPMAFWLARKPIESAK